jgi:hypothetical protein
MSIIRSAEISISELTEQSNLIVEVEFVKHFKEEVPIVNKSLKESPPKPIPPFIKKGCIFRITAILKNEGKIKVPETIQVPNENWRRSLSQHKEGHAGGVSKSFTIQEYTTEVDKIEKASILFLHHFQDTYELTARNAFEDSSAREKIDMIMGSA